MNPGSPVFLTFPPRTHMALGSQGEQPALRHCSTPTPTRSCPGVTLPLTLQLLSSSADRMMVPHFFPGTPLGEEKMKEWRARQRQTQSLNTP